ncbi:TerB family tellurite resistance protein [Paracoccaceae bacterium GXU_MW_L88]
MFEALRRMLANDTEDRLDVADEKVAFAALLVRLARADEHYAEAEKRSILGVLRENYDLDAAGAQDLLTEGERFETEAPDTQRFTHRLKQAVPYEERIHLVESLWTVALSDGNRDSEEDGFLRLVVSLLGVSDPDSGMARQRAMKKI